METAWEAWTVNVVQKRKYLQQRKRIYEEKIFEPKNEVFQSHFPNKLQLKFFKN
jgi:hypothetical protein